MRTEIVSSMREMECYACGSSDVAMLCHHCGRGICRVHGWSTQPKNQFHIRGENREYAGLDLKEIAGDETAVHCEHCKHDLTPYELALYIQGAIGILAIIGGFRMSGWLGFLFVLLGLAITGIVAWGIYVQRQYDSTQRYRPPLPVFGGFLAVTARESVQGSVELDAKGKYVAVPEHAKGSLNFSPQLTPQDQELLEKYRTKYKLPR